MKRYSYKLEEKFVIFNAQETSQNSYITKVLVPEHTYDIITFCYKMERTSNMLALSLEMNMFEHSGYKDFVWAVEINQFALRILGLWPKINGKTKENFHSDLRMSIVFIINILTIIPIMCSIIRVWGNMILVIENTQLTLCLIISTLKLVIMRWKRTALSSVVKMIEEDWMKLQETAERNVMIQQARNARLIVICGYVLIICTFNMIIIGPLFDMPFRQLTNLTDRDRALPLPSYYFYDTGKSPQYELTFFLQAAGTLLGPLPYISVDAFLGLLVFHICGQLENYRRRLDNLVYCKDFKSSLRINVEIHIRLIRFIDNVEDIFSLMTLGLLFTFAIVFCLFGFLCITTFTNVEISNVPLTRIYYVISGVVILLAQMFLYCGAGEMIAEHYEAVYCTISGLEWYKLESRNRRMFILLLMRTNEPLRITAGKIIPLSMTTLCSLLKTTAGYISFLLAKQD